MIHYAKGEAWEYRQNRAQALAEYHKAEELMLAPHWKQVVADTVRRIQAGKNAEAFFDGDDFEALLWLAFQKVYKYVHLDDFPRYVALSALSRGSSEWSLALVDFRTVLELEIKHTFPEIIEQIRNDYSLYGALKALE